MLIASSLTIAFVIYHKQFQPRPFTHHDQSYFILDGYDNGYCDVYQTDGTFLVTVPLKHCLFLGDGSAVGGAKNKLVFQSAQGTQWSHDLDVDHDISVSSDESEISVVSLIRKKKDIPPLAAQIITIFDHNGNTVFVWDEQDSIPEVKRELPELKMDKYVWHKRTQLKMIRFTNINGTQIIPSDFLLKYNPSFKKGNILVSDWGTRSIFIIDRMTKKITWVLDLHQLGYDAPHSVELTKDGKIQFFVNNFLGGDFKNRSGFASYEVQNKTFVEHPILESKHGELVCSSAYHFHENKFVVLLSSERKVFTIDEKGRTLNHLINDSNSKRKEGGDYYRVRAVPKANVDAYLRQSST